MRLLSVLGILILVTVVSVNGGRLDVILEGYGYGWQTTLGYWSWPLFAKLIERTGVVVEEVEVVGALGALAEVGDEVAAAAGHSLVD